MQGGAKAKTIEIEDDTYISTRKCKPAQSKLRCATTKGSAT